MELIVNIGLMAASVYLLCGVLFAIGFLAKGITAIDEAAHGSTIGFRIIILPGVVVFWPFLLKKWIVSKRKQSNA